MYQPSINHPFWGTPIDGTPMKALTDLNQWGSNSVPGQGRTMNVLALGNWCGTLGQKVLETSVKSLEASESGLVFLGVLYLVVSCRTDYSILMFVECFIPNV